MYLVFGSVYLVLCICICIWSICILRTHCGHYNFRILTAFWPHYYFHDRDRNWPHLFLIILTATANDRTQMCAVWPRTDRESTDHKTAFDRMIAQTYVLYIPRVQISQLITAWKKHRHCDHGNNFWICPYDCFNIQQSQIFLQVSS